MSREFWIETYGCQMNKAESEALVLSMQAAGWSLSANLQSADCVILNTCSVRKTAENRIWGRLGFYKHEKSTRDFKLVVVGCMSQRLKEDFFETAPEIDLLVGNYQKQRIPDAIEELFRTNQRLLMTEETDYLFEPYHSSGGFKAFVPIMHGCNNYCSYCIVPYVRGPEVSRDPREIAAELDRLADSGVQEVTLLGQNVNSYRYENGSRGIRFPELLQLLVQSRKRIPWIRFLTSHPKDLSEELISVVRDQPQICRHIHLPVQHGSNRMLKAMQRGYTRDEYIELVDNLKNSITDVSLSTDILIGFPGEEEEDFQSTADLMRQVRFSDAFTYKYNPREGTRAFDYGDTVPESTKLERLAKIIDLQREISRTEKAKRIGSTARVLVERHSKKNRRELLGRTERDEMVVVPGEAGLIGRFSVVELEALRGSTFVGKQAGRLPKEVVKRCPGV